MGRLMIEGNSVYEIDEQCLREKLRIQRKGQNNPIKPEPGKQDKKIDQAVENKENGMDAIIQVRFSVLGRDSGQL